MKLKNSEKQAISARINKKLFDIYKCHEIPLTTVIECSLVSFLKMTDEEKILFINHNLPEKTDTDEFKKINGTWKEMLEDACSKLNVPKDVSKLLLAGKAIKGILMIAGLILSTTNEGRFKK